MKIILMMVVILLLPVEVFFTVLLYGPSWNTVITSSLRTSSVYSHMSSFIKDLSFEVNDEEQYTQFFPLLSERFTTPYIQTKVEKFVDDSYAWMTGVSSIQPTLSFKEFKEDIMAKNPELLTALETMTQDIQEENSSPIVSEEASAESVDSTELQKQTELIRTFIHSDFTIPMGRYPDGLKNFYSAIRLLHPLLLVIMLLSVTAIFFMNQALASKCKWLAATLLLSGVWGYVMIGTFLLAVTGFERSVESFLHPLTRIIMPVIVLIVKEVAMAFSTFQGITSIVLLVVSAICYILAEVTKQKVQTAKSKSSEIKK